MEELLLSIHILLVLIVGMGIPIVLLMGLYRLLRNKEIDKKWKALALLPVIVVGYITYRALYPPEDFYRQDFKEVTGTELIREASFEFKSASYPDQHGDYNSVSIIDVGSVFYDALPSTLITNGLTENGDRIGSSEVDAAERNLHGRTIIREFSRQARDTFCYVAFLSDKKTILVQRSSY